MGIGKLNWGENENSQKGYLKITKKKRWLDFSKYTVYINGKIVTNLSSGSSFTYKVKDDTCTVYAEYINFGSNDFFTISSNRYYFHHCNDRFTELEIRRTMKARLIEISLLIIAIGVLTSRTLFPQWFFPLVIVFFIIWVYYIIQVYTKGNYIGIYEKNDS